MAEADRLETASKYLMTFGFGLMWADLFADYGNEALFWGKVAVISTAIVLWLSAQLARHIKPTGI